MKKSLPLAYLLWAFFGYLGVHRFYLRSPGWGLIYLFTGGLFSVGWFVDAFTIPAQVDHINREWRAFGHIAPARLLSTGRRRRRKGDRATWELDLFAAARASGGTLTVAEAARATSTTMAEAERRLDDLTRNGRCDVENRDTGSVCYRFVD